MESVGRNVIYALKTNRSCCVRGLRRDIQFSYRTISTTAYRAAKQKPKSAKSVPKPPLEYRTPTPKKPKSIKAAPKPQQEHRTPNPKDSFNGSSESSVPRPPPSPKELPRWRRNYLIGGGIIFFVFVTYTTATVVRINKLASSDEQSAKVSLSDQADVSSRYDSIASTFDSDVEWYEWMYGITKERKKMVQKAYGDVLEVSIGTGRNLDFYDWDFKGFNGVGKISDDAKEGIKSGKVKSFTAVDKSAEMLEVAHEKFSKLFPGVVGVRWIVQDAVEKIPGPPRNANERGGNKDGGYDTVVQTMGLCSVTDPVKLLRNLGDCVKEEEGRILLLEHGRGKWNWLNKYLDYSAEQHAKDFGCWWNRELGEFVKESGLEVVGMERRHGGTLWKVELKKPKKSITDEAKVVLESIKEVVTEEKEEEQKKGDKKEEARGWWPFS